MFDDDPYDDSHRFLRARQKRDREKAIRSGFFMGAAFMLGIAVVVAGGTYVYLHLFGG